MGFKLGTSYVGCPTCADDIMLCAKSEQEAQTQLYIIKQCTSNDRVKINSKKTEIIRINDNKAKNKPRTLFKETISVKTSLKHLGIERQKNNRPDIEKRISIGVECSPISLVMSYSLICMTINKYLVGNKTIK